MGKVIVSPVERWAGTVTLHDPLTLPQVAAYAKAERAMRALGDDAYPVERYNALMPGVYACIERMDLKNWPGVSPETFPMKPSKDAFRMGAWLVGELGALIDEANEEVPKESGLTPTPKPTEPQTTEPQSEAQS